MKTKHFLLTWLLGWLMVMPIATMAQEPQALNAAGYKQKNRPAGRFFLNIHSFIPFRYACG